MFVDHTMKLPPYNDKSRLLRVLLETLYKVGLYLFSCNGRIDGSLKGFATHRLSLYHCSFVCLSPATDSNN